MPDNGCSMPWRWPLNYCLIFRQFGRTDPEIGLLFDIIKLHWSLQGQGGFKRRLLSPLETLAQEPARPVLHLKLGHLLTQESNLHAVMGAVRSWPFHSHPLFQCIRLSIEFGDSRTCFLLTRTCHWRWQGHGLGFLGCCCGGL
jgi:hypothetical protein